MEAFGPERTVVRDARSAQPCFLWGGGSAPNVPEQWLRSLVVGRYPCEQASQIACSRVGRRRTARRFGRQGMWRRCGSPRPPRAASCCLQKRVVRAAQVAEVRLPCPSALCRARALLSLSAEFFTDYKALKVCLRSCAAVRTGLNLLWCQGPACARLLGQVARGAELR